MCRRFRKKQMNRFSSELKRWNNNCTRCKVLERHRREKHPEWINWDSWDHRYLNIARWKKRCKCRPRTAARFTLLHLLGCWLATTFSFTQELQRNQYDDLPQSEITVLHKHILPSWMWFSRWNELIRILPFRYQNSEDRVYVKRVIRNFETRFVDRFWETKRR